MLHQFIFRRPKFGGTDSNRKQLFKRNGISQLVKSHNYICDLHRGLDIILLPVLFLFSHPIQLDCLKCMDTDVSISFLPFPVFPSNRTWKHHICLLYPPTKIMEDFRLFPPSNHSLCLSDSCLSYPFPRHPLHSTFESTFKINRIKNDLPVFGLISSNSSFLLIKGNCR